jgi:hypothetical protein
MPLLAYAITEVKVKAATVNRDQCQKLRVFQVIRPVLEEPGPSGNALDGIPASVVKDWLGVVPMRHVVSVAEGKDPVVYAEDLESAETAEED